MPHGSVIAGFWMEVICENVARAACTLWSRGSWLGGACMAFSLFVVRSCFIFATGVILSYHLFWYVSDDYELTSWSPAVLFCFVSCSVLFGLCFLFCFCFVVFVCLFCVGWMSLHGESSMDYVSILIQFLFWCTLSIRWCCHCINSLNLQICNWLSGLLNDLARATWRWTEKNPQLKTSKLAQNCGKTEVLHLQPSYGVTAAISFSGP